MTPFANILNKMWIFRLIRLPNLLIVALTQYLLNYLLLFPYFKKAGLSPSLDHFHFFLLVLTTILIAAAGFVINDIIDLKSDTVNKPDKILINNRLSLKKALIFYFGIVFSGIIFAIYLALYVGQFPLFFIYPAAVIMLWSYSKFFKKSILTGNFVVGLFCAFVAGIVLFAERETFSILRLKNPEIGDWVGLLFGGYILFAFISTLFREIIKDMEDTEGDRELGCRTLPIVMGIRKAKIIAGLFGFVLWGMVLFFAFWLLKNHELPGFIFSVIGVLLPTSISLYWLKNSQEKKDFHKLSQLAKFIMLSGLILLIIISL